MMRLFLFAAFALGMAWDSLQRRWRRLLHGDVEYWDDSRWVGWHWRIIHGEKPRLDKYTVAQLFHYEQVKKDNPDTAALSRASHMEILRELVRRKTNQYEEKYGRFAIRVLTWAFGIISTLIVAYLLKIMGLS